LSDYFWPYGTLTIFAGVTLVRSLFFGAFLGLVCGKVGRCAYERLIDVKKGI